MFDFLSKKFSSAFSWVTGQNKLTEKNIGQVIDKIKEALLEADVPYDVVENFIDQVSKEVIGQKVLTSLKPAEQFMKVVHDKVVQFLSDENKFSLAFDAPKTLIMVMGLQGSGKTTTISKLVGYALEQAKQSGKKLKVGAGSVDFYRPAAVDQLQINLKNTGCSFYCSSLEDPVMAAQDIVNQAYQDSCDLVFLDTAGRMHVDQQMLEELKSVDTNLKPKYKLLIIDGMTGQESLNIAKNFNDSIGFDGAILTKMDSDARGGLAFAFRFVLQKPILFLATGEKVGDLELFKPDRMASRIIGMGDMMSLVEKAQEKIKQHDQEALYKSMMEGKFTLQDFASQMEMVNKLGSLSKLAKYLPGVGSFNLTHDMIEKGEQEMKRFKAIISSMTPKERLHPKILDNARKNRIARGSGVTIADVNSLLNKFEQSQQFVKLFRRMGR